MSLNLDKVVTFRMTSDEYEDIKLLVEGYNIKGIKNIKDKDITKQLKHIQKSKDRKNISQSAGDIIRLGCNLLLSRNTDIIECIKEGKSTYINKIKNI